MFKGLWALGLSLALALPVVAQTQAGVARAQFSSAMDGLEPVDDLGTLVSRASHEQLYFFSELQETQGLTVSHRWFYQDLRVAEIFFLPAGPRWRVNSYKTMLPIWAGEWRVEVVAKAHPELPGHEVERVLATHYFIYQ